MALLVIINPYMQKKKAKIIKPSLLIFNAYHHALQCGTMAPSWNYATIKEGKDLTKCQSYSSCILTAILAKRVSKIDKT